MPESRGSSVARPGFVNVRLAPEIWHAQLRAILQIGPAYGDSEIGGGRPVNVEFVSANPTGPMHVGHGRGAVVGLEEVHVPPDADAEKMEELRLKLEGILNEVTRRAYAIVGRPEGAEGALHG